MSTTLSKKHLSLQLNSESPLPLSPCWSASVVLSVLELLFRHLAYFRFQPKNGMRPMTKERIHKIAMISLAVFPVINSLYLEKTQQWLLAFKNRRLKVEYSPVTIVPNTTEQCEHKFIQFPNVNICPCTSHEFYIPLPLFHLLKM